MSIRSKVANEDRSLLGASQCVQKALRRAHASLREAPPTRTGYKPGAKQTRQATLLLSETLRERERQGRTCV
jgi:hypothetical protein